ncbi:hypothetical protein N8J89_29560 [Crossiella sp. CA-258035]|uniref:hypothetical protein n=1 Tax=Crossiella sp. CA-258035 TaxID=2981138 RepID=UPI0024BC0FBB|nr:hypothetical protein [Crossiella sp. CA-258035]WHT17253.1 hypothetical protein N8J89_29560 [Crossiella sp. CA-258035]
MTEQSTVDRSRGGMGDVHDVSGMLITGNDGPVLTGGGTLHVTYNQLREGLDDGPQRHRWVSPERVGWLRGRFVEPRGFHEAAARLARAGIVLVHGSPGSGRRSAAIMLLAGSAVTGDIREISVAPGEAELFDPDVVAAERLLLDLSTVEPAELAQAGGLLDVLTGQVRRSGGALVVVLPAGTSPRTGGFFGDQLAEIVLEPGQRRRLLESHLRAGGVAVSAADLDDPRLAAVHQAHPAEELARLAELLTAERPRHESFAGTVETALAAYRNWAEELGERFREHTDPRWRALIVTAALLEGTRIEAVHQACSILLARTGDPVPEQHPLAAEPLTRRLAQVGALVREDRVWFGKLAYGEAVLHHVWRELPGLREVLTHWVERLPTAPRTMMSTADRRRMADRFTELALHSGERTDLRWLTRHWADSNNPRVVPLALSTLRLSMFDRAAGGYFRQMLAEWSRVPGSSPNRARVVITACAEVLNESHLPLALAMLQNLLAHQDPAVVAEARELLLGMAVTTSARFSVLRRVTEAMARGDGLAANTSVFRVLTAPPELFAPDGVSVPLWSTPGVRELLLTGWRAVFGQEPPEESVEAVRDWLRLVDGSIVDGDRMPSLVQLLVDACDGDYRLLAVLRRITADWVVDATDQVPANQREWVLAWVDEKIEDAQDNAWTRTFGEGSLGG